MQNEYPTHWLEGIVNNILEKNTPEVTLATGKTPSGHIHLGILREIIICDAIRRKLEEHGEKVNFFLFFDSLDAAKRFPEYIDEDYSKENLGKPFSKMPCPFDEINCNSYAEFFGNELSSTFKEFGIKVNVKWTHELYQGAKMKEKIKIALKNSEEIKEITGKNWLPALVICENCNRILKTTKVGTEIEIVPNRVLSYNLKENSVKYSCPSCGHKTETSIDGGALKLNWRVDWPAKWSLFQTTCEPAGKDHSTPGGSYDTGIEICQKIFNYEGPVKLPYEWMRLGEKDMKTSKGIVFTPRKYLKMADAEILRLFILRTDPNKHISFRIEELYQLYDFYEKMENVYFGLEEANSEEEEKFLKYIYPLCQIEGIPEEKPPRLPLNFLITMAQIQKISKFEEIFEKANKKLKGLNYRQYSFDEFKFRLKRTENLVSELKNIIENEENQKIKRQIASKYDLFEIPDNITKEIIKDLDDNQKNGLKLIKEYMERNEDLTEDELQNKTFNIAKEILKIPPKKMFQAIYSVILGQSFGPRLGPFLLMLDKEWLIKRLSIE